MLKNPPTLAIVAVHTARRTSPPELDSARQLRRRLILGKSQVRAHAPSGQRPAAAAVVDRFSAMQLRCVVRRPENRHASLAPAGWVLNFVSKYLHFHFEFATRAKTPESCQNSKIHLRLKTLNYRLYRRRF